MKIYLKYFALTFIPLALIGCGLLTTSPNPAYITISPTGQLVTNAVSPVIYSPPANLATISNEASLLTPVVQAVMAATPAAPVASYVPSAVNWVFGTLGAIFAALAAYKNNQANQQAAAAATLAAAITAHTESPLLTASAMKIATTNNSQAATAVA